MMDELQIVGLLVAGLVTIGGFIAVILKFIQPINELRVMIQKLIDTLDSLKNDNSEHGKRLDIHDAHFNALDGRVGTLETKMGMYHHND